MGKTRPLIYSIFVSFSVGLLTGCSVLSDRIGTQQANYNPIGADGTYRYESGQALRCEAEFYFIDVAWNEGQPTMQYGRVPSQVTLTSPASFSTNTDGSVTYTNLEGSSNVSALFNTNGSCLIREIAATGSVVTEESGRVVTSDPIPSPAPTQSPSPSPSPTESPTVSPSPSPNNQDYDQGYSRGYAQGYQDGQNAKYYNTGYNPDQVFQQGAQSGIPEFDRGYQDGFYRGFNEGYNSVSVAPSPNPTNPTTPNNPQINGLW